MILLANKVKKVEKFLNLKIVARAIIKRKIANGIKARTHEAKYKK